ncbi:MAG: SdrD B-like domain-containing protein [Clostridia bacterium]|jgi:hypothetical protein
MKVLRKLLICIFTILVGYLIFSANKVFAMSEYPHLKVGQSGINILFTNLTEYDSSQPYNCTQQGVKALCAEGGSHYYTVSHREEQYTIGTSGTPASITSNTRTVKWSKENATTYKVGPYSVKYTGSITGVTISTDKGTVNLNNNSSSGNYRVGNITNGGQFYIYIKKSARVKKVNSVTVNVEGTVTRSARYRYILYCTSTSGYHGRWKCYAPENCQILEHYQTDEDSSRTYDSVELPGALGMIELNIYKRDKYLPNVGVPGAKYELWTDGKLTHSGTTNSSGHLKFEEVLIGDYVIKEVYVPYNFEIKGYATINGKKFTDLTNMRVELDSDSSMYVYNESYIDLKGKVFLDKKTGKGNDPPNGYYDSADSLVQGIEVKLYRADNNQELATKYTDSSGYYEFKHYTKAHEYYIRFKYNGQIYECTTYNETSASIKLRSYATEGINERRAFNNKFTPVNASHKVPNRDDTGNAQFIIYAYTGSNGPNNKKKYGKNNTKEELDNINLGLMERDIFDMNLRKDLVKVDVSINGKDHTYQYNGNGEDLEVNIRGTDVPDYERKLRKSDLQYKTQDDNAKDKLQVYVTYKIQIKNQSVGKLTGYVLDLNDYADTSYELIDSYDENGKKINWTQSGNVSGSGKTYKKMHTTDLASTGITDKKWIFLKYKVSNDTLKEVLQKGETLEENYAEIAGYRNTYTNERRDTEGRLLSNAGENAGLIDRDSTPDNMNPTSSKVQNFVAQSKTSAYQNLSGEEKTKRSTEVFEDDADVAPGLRLIRDDEGRKMSGVVFEDAPLQAKLNNNERVGDGIYQNGENKVNKVKVELLCQNNKDVDRLNKIEVRTNSDGSYTLDGFIPGDYLIKFTYGDYECLVSPQNNNEMYTGQDYKSTIYEEGNYKDVYWYKNTQPRENDAVDDYEGRRQEVNEYSKDYKYDIAQVLNSSNTNNPELLATLAEKTYMVANTAEMSMEVEYLKDDTAPYKVQNIDLGIIERPRTEVILNKEVSNVKLTSTDGTTIFDTNQKAPNLTWVNNKYDRDHHLSSQGLIQGTVDENLLYGSNVNVKYLLKIINNSELDYNEKSYYTTGIVQNKNTLNRIETTGIIEYVPNILQYDAKLTKEDGKITTSIGGRETTMDVGGNNNLWNVLASKVESKNLPSNYKGTLLEPGAFDEAKQKLDEILETNLNLAKRNLGPTDYLELKDILTFTRVIARPEDTSDKEEIQNVAEIIRLNIDNGRRPYYKDTTNREIIEIPGNTYPHTLKNIEEIDTARSEILTFVVPFGKDKQITLIIVMIASLTILITGIIVIKKKVL